MFIVKYLTGQQAKENRLGDLLHSAIINTGTARITRYTLGKEIQGAFSNYEFDRFPHEIKIILIKYCSPTSYGDIKFTLPINLNLSKELELLINFFDKINRNNPLEQELRNAFMLSGIPPSSKKEKQKKQPLEISEYTALAVTPDQEVENHSENWALGDLHNALISMDIFSNVQYDQESREISLAVEMDNFNNLDPRIQEILGKYSSASSSSGPRRFKLILNDESRDGLKKLTNLLTKEGKQKEKPKFLEQAKLLELEGHPELEEAEDELGHPELEKSQEELEEELEKKPIKRHVGEEKESVASSSKRQRRSSPLVPPSIEPASTQQASNLAQFHQQEQDVEDIFIAKKEYKSKLLKIVSDILGQKKIEEMGSSYKHINIEKINGSRIYGFEVPNLLKLLNENGISAESHFSSDNRYYLIEIDIEKSYASILEEKNRKSLRMENNISLNDILLAKKKSKSELLRFLSDILGQKKIEEMGSSYKHINIERINGSKIYGYEVPNLLNLLNENGISAESHLSSNNGYLIKIDIEKSFESLSQKNKKRHSEDVASSSSKRQRF